MTIKLIANTNDWNDDIEYFAEGEFVHFFAGYDDVVLDGSFTVSDLEMIIAEMKRHLTKRAPDLWDSAPSQALSPDGANPAPEHLPTPPTSG